MIQKSQYSRSFYSDRLTTRKYQALRAHGESLLAARNELSVLVNSDLLAYQQMTKIDFQKRMLPLIKDRVVSLFKFFTVIFRKVTENYAFESSYLTIRIISSIFLYESGRTPTVSFHGMLSLPLLRGSHSAARR